MARLRQLARDWPLGLRLRRANGRQPGRGSGGRGRARVGAELGAQLYQLGAHFAGPAGRSPGRRPHLTGQFRRLALELGGRGRALAQGAWLARRPAAPPIGAGAALLRIGASAVVR